MNTTRFPLRLESCTVFLRAFLTAVVLGILAGATLSSVAYATAAPLANGNTEAISRAGSVRQQAQRIAKLYLQLGMGLEVANTGKQLAGAVQQIDKDLAALEQRDLDAAARNALKRASATWAELRNDCKAPFSAGNKNRVFDSADALSRHSGRLAGTFERSGSETSAGLLDLSLRQNMLVQRLARLYLQAYSGDKSTGLQVDIEQARREFSSALDDLAHASVNSEASRRALDLTKMQWIFFERAIENVHSPRDSNPGHVASTSEQILELLDEVSTQYARG